MVKLKIINNIAPPTVEFDNALAKALRIWGKNYYHFFEKKTKKGEEKAKVNSPPVDNI